MRALRISLLPQILPPAVLVLSLLAVYLYTLAPGLTWAHAGSDGGDLITAAATGGVAHPTGYPLYLILARLFQMLPVGSLAFRTNLMSALATALAAGLLYRLVVRHLSAAAGAPVWPAGLAAGYALGLAPLVWSQALITEVYALQAILTVLILMLYVQPEAAGASARRRVDLGRGLALGLGAANHLTALLLVPAALLLGTLPPEADPAGHPRPARLRPDASRLGRQVAGFLAGLGLYLSLPLRAMADPPVNWGNAVTPGRLWWLVSGQLYQSHYLGTDLAGVWERMRAWSALLLEQFGLPGLILGLAGLIVFGSRSRTYLFTGWMAAVSLAFAVLYRSEDSYVYLIPVFIAFAVWVGLGSAGMAIPLSRRAPAAGLVFGLLLAAYFVARGVTNMGSLDASHDLRAEAFGRDVLSAVPQDAVLFAAGDRAVFSLWYFHFALGQRPDLAVIAADLLHFDWYQESLRSTYPSLAIPGPFPWPQTIAAANPERPACHVRYEERAEIDCSRPAEAP